MGLISSMGAGKAAAQQAKAEREIANEWENLGKTQLGWFQPYMNAGTQSLTTAMQMLANPINSQAALSDYFGSAEYGSQEQQAQYAEQSAAEATGSLGSTATGNALASESTQLGQNYLKSLNSQRQSALNSLTGFSKMGLSASGTMGNLSVRDMEGRAQALDKAAGLEGQSTMAPYAGAQAFTDNLINTGIKGYGAYKGYNTRGMRWE